MLLKVEQKQKVKLTFRFHNAGVGGSRPPVATIYKAFINISLSYFSSGLRMGYSRNCF